MSVTTEKHYTGSTSPRGSSFSIGGWYLPVRIALRRPNSWRDNTANLHTTRGPLRSLRRSDGDLGEAARYKIDGARSCFSRRRRLKLLTKLRKGVLEFIEESASSFVDEDTIAISIRPPDLTVHVD